MKINEFIKQYNSLTSDEDRNMFLKQTITTTYIPFIEKTDTCLKILNNAWYQKDPITDKKQLHITSPAEFVLFNMVVINKYTSLDIDFKGNIFEQYDLLNNGNYLGILLSYIPENEIKEYRIVLEMTKNDVLQNEYYTPAYLSNRIQDISTALGASLIPAIEEFGKMINGLDEEKVKNIAGILDNNKVIKTLKSFMKR